jgi:hypothetical protein
LEKVEGGEGRGEQIILEVSMKAELRNPWPETLEKVEGGNGRAESAALSDAGKGEQIILEASMEAERRAVTQGTLGLEILTLEKVEGGVGGAQ